MNKNQIVLALMQISSGFNQLAAAMEGDETPAQTDATGEPAKTTRTRAKKETAAVQATEASTVGSPTAQENFDLEPTPAPAAQAATTQPAASTSKSKAPEFLTLTHDQKIDFLRQKMVDVSVKCQGDRNKTFSFLSKYKANKVAEVPEADLVNLYTDIEVFLKGPDALGV